MNISWKSLPSLGSFLLLAANTFAVSPPPANEAPPANAPRDDERQLHPLLERLTALNQLIERGSQSPDLWQYHLEQAEVLLHLALQSQPKEREGMLRMAVDAQYSAALLCPRGQPLAMQRLRELPYRLGHAFPGNPAIMYAIFQEIQADCALVMEQNNGDRVKSEEHRCQRLLQFAQEHPQASEAIKAVQQAAQIRESLNQTEEASRCYRFLVEHFPNDPAARKAEGSLWRLGANHEPMQLQLPLLYAAGTSNGNAFNLDELRGKVVVLYFWSSTSASVVEDFEVLKQLTDRYSSRGLEVVYVNLDADPAQGRAFLSGRLTAGVHCHQAGGLESPVAERYGLQELPQIFVVGRDGTLLKHSLPMSRLEVELTGHATHSH